MDVSTIANLASALAVIVAVFFGTLQLRHMAKTRVLLGACELVRAMQTADFAKGVRLVMSLPDGVEHTRIGRTELSAQSLSI